MKKDMSKCAKCRNAVLYIGAYTNTRYLECKLLEEAVEKMTFEELEYSIKHPEEDPCEYVKGNPEDGGVTFDD